MTQQSRLVVHEQPRRGDHAAAIRATTRATWRTRISVAALSVALAACGDPGGGDGEGSPTTAARGGTLKVVGSADVDHLATTSAYYTVSNFLLRTFARQLVANPADPDFAVQATLAPDLATAVPTRENGGISEDGRIFTFRLRRGIMWNTQPPREFVAADIVRGIKFLCNPVSPVGAPGYYTSTIQGMKSFCDAFLKVNGTVDDIRRFANATEIDGVRAPDDSTVVFTLVAPASDFLNILSMPFASPVPVEYLDYMPDGPEFRRNTVSIGPYQIRTYIAGRQINLGRNPVWNPDTDPIRKAWVDSIEILQGISAQSTQQQMQAGTADLSWDHIVPTAEIALLLASNDEKLTLGPPGEQYAANQYMPLNLQSPNENDAMKKLEVRQALQYAVNRAAVAQVYGGPRVSRPLHQAVVGGSAGYRAEFNPYPTPADTGDPAKAKELLARAGYANGLTVKLLYRTNGTSPQVAQTVQAALSRAGIRSEMVPSTGSDFYSKYLENPENARRGVWDVAVAGWVPDWFGNNGRSMIQALFDGRTYGPNSTNYGFYMSETTNMYIDRAIRASSESEALSAWMDAATQVMTDAAIVPLTQNKQSVYHSARVQGCVFSLTGFNCDLPSLWLSGTGRGGE